MLTINTDPDPLVHSSAGLREQRSLAERAVADVAAGRRQTSEHADYGQTYQNAQRLANTEAGVVVLCIAEGTECINCHYADTGPVLRSCDCEIRDLANDTPGMFAMYGEGSTKALAPFRRNAFLRDLIRHGARIETLDGEDVSHRVQYLQ